MEMKKYLKIILLSIGVMFIFASCSTVHTVISKRNLDVQTKMSDTIWLEPVAPAQKTVFVEIRNTTGKNLNIDQKIKTTLVSKGYKIVEDPSQAKYWLQANILKVDKINLTEDNQGGFSDAVLAGGVGAFLGGQRSGGVYTAVGWGLAASAIATVADALVKDIKYAMVTDVLITEKTEKTVNVATKNSIKQGSSGTRISTSTEQTNMDKYSTRVLSIANKVNLDFNEAVPVLEDELGRVVGGIF